MVEHESAHSDIEEQITQYRKDIARLHEEKQALEERTRELEDLVNLDPTTGLPIRRTFFRLVDGLIEGEPLERLLRHLPHSFGNGSASPVVPTRRGETCAVGVVRLDRNYRRIRPSRDRENILLFKATIRIKSITGELLFQSDRIDEFLFVLPDLPTTAEGVVKAQQLVEVLSAPHEAPADDVEFGCHVGIAMWPKDSETSAELLECATMAAERAESRYEGVGAYDKTLGEAVKFRREIEKVMRESMQDGFRDFKLVYQPICDTSGRLIAAETLVRLSHPRIGRISPAEFIPVAEENGDIKVLGQWILFHACRQLTMWHNAGYTNMRISVNLSPLQFKLPDLLRRIRATIKATGIPPGALKLELTESMVMDEPELAVETMRELRDLGISLLIDDFGTGYSSLSYLRKFPVDTLKIDKSFIDDMCRNTGNRQIVRAVVAMGKSLGLETLAEGVEDECQLKLLEEFECDLIQGYYFAAPIDADRLTDILAAGEPIRAVTGDSV